MSLRLQSPFITTPHLHGSFNRKDKRINVVRKAFRSKRICSEKKHNNDWIAQVVKFSRFCGENVQLLRKSLDSRSRMEVKCLKEPFVLSRGLVKSLAPVWEEGLFFLRCSVFFAVISGVCFLVWYGQNKARTFVETKLLPSVCSVLSETIQRDVDLGKVRRVSPLCITLEACSIGPHSEEFSCGEVPTIKLCVRPFASLRRGKIVVDAILSNPTVLVAQKKDFTWLGLPLSEASFPSHLSTEEGIDFRTKTRRSAREEAGIRWDNERDNDARKAAEMGYVVPCKNSSEAKDDVVKHDRHFTEIANPNSFICMDEKMHSANQRCMDPGVDYDVKHAELEKSFGKKNPGSGLKSLSKMFKVPKKYKFKWNSKSHNNSFSDISAKKRILDRSASAALSYFHNLSQQKLDEPSVSANYDGLSLDMLLVNSEREINNQYDCNEPYDMQSLANDLDGKDNRGREKRLLSVKKASTLDKFTVSCDPFLMTVDRLGALLQTNDIENSTKGETLSEQRGNLSVNVVNQKMPAVYVEKTLPVMLDSVQFKGGTLILLAYGDTEPR